MDEFEIEREEALANEVMNSGEYMSMALKDFARDYGREERDREWILTPFDTWERNPFYTGKPGRHPEDDDY